MATNGLYNSDIKKSFERTTDSWVRFAAHYYKRHAKRSVLQRQRIGWLGWICRGAMDRFCHNLPSQYSSVA